MTYYEFRNISDKIESEYRFASHRRAQASVYGLPWSEQDAKEYDTWIKRHDLLQEWEKNVIQNAVKNFSAKDFLI